MLSAYRQTAMPISSTMTPMTCIGIACSFVHIECPHPPSLGQSAAWPRNHPMPSAATGGVRARRGPGGMGPTPEPRRWHRRILGERRLGLSQTGGSVRVGVVPETVAGRQEATGTLVASGPLLAFSGMRPQHIPLKNNAKQNADHGGPKAYKNGVPVPLPEAWRLAT